MMMIFERAKRFISTHFQLSVSPLWSNVLQALYKTLNKSRFVKVKYRKNLENKKILECEMVDLSVTKTKKLHVKAQYLTKDRKVRLELFLQTLKILVFPSLKCLVKLIGLNSFVNFLFFKQKVSYQQL